MSTKATSQGIDHLTPAATAATTTTRINEAAQEARGLLAPSLSPGQQAQDGGAATAS
eukprot:CAMPEP_0206431258 /NCGR_PEP_ID=MMETSP0324_2-20121206/7264_1 /ASSEMBLY_ACC=CAM_ASM_000836 /TAXON_ID=2866 /ORGANISM="Crypthecodinium cohnii, Strain Seligo" /LENGTH=56 /DNA_ID=CAMNT_0053897165 /DNA_START=326 /DNA_END=496 /DNA_ORIENTATION=-